jgi:DMSO/TMAO reductase YedYZ molybdopterin-dependent catalytic subunit
MTTPAAHRRVQREAEQWPVVHLESEIPTCSTLTVSGLVRHPRVLSLAELAALGAAEHISDFHCVWGWSKTAVRWWGISLGAVLDLVGVDSPTNTHVVVGSASDTYSSSLPLADARRGLLVWRRDGAELGPSAGGPLRFVNPPDYWAYKGVKWAASVTVTDHFQAGFWESKVADPLGRIDPEVELA